MVKTSKMECNAVIPLVLVKKRWLFFFILSQRGLQIASGYLINNKGINILIFQMTLNNVQQRIFTAFMSFLIMLNVSVYLF